MIYTHTSIRVIHSFLLTSAAPIYLSNNQLLSIELTNMTHKSSDPETETSTNSTLKSSLFSTIYQEHYKRTFDIFKDMNINKVCTLLCVYNS